MSVLFAYSKNSAKPTKIVIPELSSESVVEVLLDESYDYTNTITTNPIESGSDIADHVHTNPLVYSLNAIFSNAPVLRVSVDSKSLPESPAVASFFDFEPKSSKIKRQQQYAKEYEQTLSDATSEFVDYIPSIELFYEELVTKKYIVTIETKTKVLENMVCISFSYTRDKTSGTGLQISAKFQQVSIVSTDSVAIEDANSDSAESKISSTKTDSGITAETKNKGKKKTQTQSETENGSLLYNLILGR